MMKRWQGRLAQISIDYVVIVKRRVKEEEEKRMKLSLMAMLLIFSVTHQKETPVGQTARLDQEFKIKIGQESRVDNLKVKFERVPKDDRCPCGDQCASFQNAVVLLRVASPAREDKYLVLNTDSKSKEVLARGYKISLIDLDPCPEENGNIKRDEYEATLLVTKSQTATGSCYQGSNARRQGERKPNFSGTWSLEGADTGPWTPLISLNSIAHRGRKLEISFENHVRGRAPRIYHKNIYYIDGRPHTSTQTEYSKHRSTNKVEIYETSKFRSIARWDGDKLVIVDDNGQSEWELSESERELILSNGKKRMVYKRERAK